ncbi:hypothetical protein [Gloeobacter kilaueensis]|uniref:Sensor histidine kinase/response regulator n=1 Tax=Gloeobacter kilaueensis (strain ATCC BAA-2537 / CCAP 1431/1 / ULC 316 / JS1) TaxID=1183438 RepID=U5QJD9_GLOK1|nr:hypothetical protein [Gloeobacter kilaueensis]AGY58983.1 sensor histidine kinase/response regulator [Gloeobacter kilaueensis JS1]
MQPSPLEELFTARRVQPVPSRPVAQVHPLFEKKQPSVRSGELPVLVCPHAAGTIALALSEIVELIELPGPVRPSVPWRGQDVPCRSFAATSTSAPALYAIVSLDGDHLALPLEGWPAVAQCRFQPLPGPVPPPRGIAGVVHLETGQILPLIDVARCLHF